MSIQGRLRKAWGTEQSKWSFRGDSCPSSLFILRNLLLLAMGLHRDVCYPPRPPKKRQSQGTALKPLKLQVEINLFCLGTDYLQRFIVGQEAD